MAEPESPEGRSPEGKSPEGKPPEGKPAESTPGPGRVFLVVVDDTPELKTAIRYACIRAKKTSGRVAMLHVTAQEDMQEWIGV